MQDYLPGTNMSVQRLSQQKQHSNFAANTCIKDIGSLEVRILSHINYTHRLREMKQKNKDVNTCDMIT